MCLKFVDHSLKFVHGQTFNVEIRLFHLYKRSIMVRKKNQTFTNKSKRKDFIKRYIEGKGMVNW